MTTLAGRAWFPGAVIALLVACSGADGGGGGGGLGGAPPPPTCSGLPLPCAGRDPTSCNVNLGCFSESSCTGLEQSCDTIFTQSSCTD